MQGYESLFSHLAENNRLELQARGENLAAHVQALPLSNASRILEVGCGTGVFTSMIARYAIPGAKVYGLDLSASHIDFANERARQQKIANIYFLQGNMHDPGVDLPRDFDLVICRYVLITNGPREAIECLKKMKEFLAPGGEVACIEPDVNFSQQRFPAVSGDFKKILDETIEYYCRNELIDWRTGVKLFRYLQDVGFGNVGVKMIDGRIIQGGVPKELVKHDNIDVEQLLAPVAEYLGLTHRLEELSAEWRDYLSSPDHFIYTPIFMATGRN